jgi:hypothetical protein
MNFENSFWGPESGYMKSNDQVQNNQTMKWKSSDYFWWIPKFALWI